jgi:Lar family restriction alleviation protein
MSRTSPETATLLPCPFCGGAPRNTGYFGNYAKLSYAVHCDACDLCLDGDNTPEEAAKRWNTRKPGLAQTPGLEPVAWRYQHRLGWGDVWRVSDVDPMTPGFFETPSIWTVEPLYAIAETASPNTSTVREDMLEALRLRRELDADAPDAIVVGTTPVSSPDREPCEYCRNGKRTGLPGNACENCMNTGLKNPTAEDLGIVQHNLPGHEETLDALNSLTIRPDTRPLRTKGEA